MPNYCTDLTYTHEITVNGGDVSEVGSFLYLEPYYSNPGWNDFYIGGDVNPLGTSTLMVEIVASSQGLSSAPFLIQIDLIEKGYPEFKSEPENPY